MREISTCREKPTTLEFSLLKMERLITGGHACKSRWRMPGSARPASFTTWAGDSNPLRTRLSLRGVARARSRRMRARLTLLQIPRALRWDCWPWATLGERIKKEAVILMFVRADGGEPLRETPSIRNPPVRNGRVGNRLPAG